MTNYTEDLTGLDTIVDPTDADLDTFVEDDDELNVWVDDDADYSYSAVDDRYEGTGVPAWSAWA